MTKKVSIYWGGVPSEKSETKFLSKIKADLEILDVSAFIFANFYTRNNSRQVDFLIITDNHVCHVELKSYSGVLIGGTNGQWFVKQKDGFQVLIDRNNPYAQTLNTKFSIANDLKDYAIKKGCPIPDDGAMYKKIDSVLCIFPQLENGSEVPSDYKVNTMGYKEFVQYLISPGKTPGWQKQHWKKIIKDYGLLDASKIPKDISLKAANKILSDYSNNFNEFFSVNLPKIVAINSTINGKKIVSTKLITLFDNQKTIQVIGLSGSGKTHLTLHTMLKAQKNEFIPFFLRANQYSTKLSNLIHRSSASFSKLSPFEIFELAKITNKKILIALDGFNECSPKLRETLIQDLSALRLKYPVILLISSQSPIKLPSSFNSSELHISLPNENERIKILHQYKAKKDVVYYQAFSTPYELSLAATCSNELGNELTRENLFSSFIGKQLNNCSSPFFSKYILKKIAVEMNELLSTSLSSTKVWRIIETNSSNSFEFKSAEEALNSKLIVKNQDTISFSHESIGRFLVAETVGLNADSPKSLAKSIRRPRNKDIRSSILIFSKYAYESIRLIQSSSLILEAFRGNFGKETQKQIEGDIKKTLVSVTTMLKKARVTIKSQFEYEFDKNLVITKYQIALLKTIGKLINEGYFIDEIVELFLTSDELCANRAIKSDGDKPERSLVVSVLYVGFSNQNKSPAAIILNAYEESRFSRCINVQPVNTKKISQIIKLLDSDKYGLLMLLSYMFRFSDSKMYGNYLPTILKLGWESKAYHVMLEILWATQSYSQILTGSTKEKVIELLQSFKTSNVVISTFLVDAMYSYDLIGDISTEEQVTQEIKALLKGKRDENTYQLANGVVCNQFESIFSDAYCTAINHLNNNDKTELLTMAALGAKYQISTDWIFIELLKLNNKKSLPAFEKYTTQIDENSSCPQATAASFTLAYKGWAVFHQSPSKLKNLSNHAFQAWQAYGEIIFWINKTENKALLRKKCEAIWEKLSTTLLDSAIDPMFHFSTVYTTSKEFEYSAHSSMMKNFPVQIKNLYEKYLINTPKQITIFNYFDEKSVIKYVINILGDLGDMTTIEVLNRYSDDYSFGMAAVSSIKKIETKNI